MGKSSGSNTTTSTSGPPQAFLDAYQNTYNQGQNVAAAPLQQYNAGPNASNIVAPLQPNQNAAINDISNLQGVAQPYINTAQGYVQSAATPIQPMSFGSSPTALTGQGLAGFGTAAGQAGSVAGTGAGLAGAVAPYTSGATAPINLPGYNTLGTYFNPYQQNVTQATQQLMNEQNAEQLAQVRGNAITSSAFGGDREAIAEAETARQQALADNPTLAGIQQQGFAQAQGELTSQQQLDLQQQQAERGLQLGAGQLTEGAGAAGGQLGLGAGQLGLAAGQGLLGEFNTQQQAGIGAQEATGWLNQGAGYGMANLGQESLSTGLAGANALMGAGNTQQGQAQQVLNVPYEQFIQQQAYPFQTTGWLANIAEGLGGASGGTSSTTYPGPSVAGQVAGAGLAGLGIYGVGQNQGWWGSGGAGGNSGLSAADQASGLYNATDFGGGGDMPTYESGGRVTNAARGGRMGLADPPRFAVGGVPDLSMSVVPGGGGLGAAPQPGSGGGGLHKAFLQPDTSTTQTSGGGGGGILGLVGAGVGLATGMPWLGLAGTAADKLTGFESGGAVPGGTFDDNGAGLARRFLAAGGRIHFDDGGTPGLVTNNGTPMRTITLQVPDLSKGYIPPTTTRNATMGPPKPPSAPQQPNPISQAISGVSGMQGLEKLFNPGTSSGNSGTVSSESLGGAVEPSTGPLQGFAFGGSPGGAQAAFQAGSMQSGAGNPMAQNLTGQYAQMSVEQLQEMAMRVPPTTPQGIAIARALQMKKMTAGSSYPGGASPSGPAGASGDTQPGTTAARGGRMGLQHFDDGGGLDPGDPLPSAADVFTDPLSGAPMTAPKGEPPTSLGLAQALKDISVTAPARDETLPPLQTSTQTQDLNLHDMGAAAADRHDEGLAAPATTPLATSSPPASVTPAEQGNGDWSGRPMAVGDSIGTGYIRFGGLHGKWGKSPADTEADSAVSRTPQQVLDFIKSRPDDYFAGRPVVLSSGVSNDPSQISLVPDQLAALRNRGASEVQLAGVGDRPGTEGGKSYDLSPHNATLQQYAKDAGVNFGGPLPAVVHPDPGYYRNAGAFRGSDAQVLAAAPAASNQALAAPPPSSIQPSFGARLVTPSQADAGDVSRHDPRGVVPLIRSTAEKYGINPDIAVRVAGSEGLGNFKSTIPGEESYSAFQLNMLPGSMGDQFKKETGLDPSDPKNEPAAIDYALRSATKVGWSPFHGARQAGIGPWQGIGGAPSQGGDQIVGPGTGKPGLATGPAGAPQAGGTPANGLATPPSFTEHEPREKSFMSSPWMPLIAVGAGMMASRSPHMGTAIGEGLETGLKVAGQQNTRENQATVAESRATAAEARATSAGNLAAVRQQSADQQGAHLADMAGHYKDMAAASSATASARADTAQAKRQADERKAELELYKISAPRPGFGKDAQGNIVAGTWQMDPQKGWDFQPGAGAGRAPQEAGAVQLLNRKMDIGRTLYPNNEQAAADFATGKKAPTQAEWVRAAQAQEKQLAANFVAGHPAQAVPNFHAQAEKETTEMFGSAPGAPAQGLAPSPPTASSTPPQGTTTQPMPRTAGAPMPPRPPDQATATAAARAAIAAGKPHDAIVEQVKQWGYSPAGL